MSVKIQINSLSALERLIGNDNELELELRQSIVESFAKKHLTCIANNPFFQKEIKELQKDIKISIQNEVKNSIGQYERKGWSPTLILKEEIIQKIQERIDGEFDKILAEEFEDIQKELQQKFDNIMASFDLDYCVNNAAKIVTKQIREKLESVEKHV